VHLFRRIPVSRTLRRNISAAKYYISPLLKNSSKKVRTSDDFKKSGGVSSSLVVCLSGLKERT
jgi:hypothetical protein